jgi:hypothetical protein
MWGYTTAVGAAALALTVVSAIVGGLLFFVLPVAILAVAVAAGLDFNRRRLEVNRMAGHAQQASPGQDQFTERDHQTLISSEERLHSVPPENRH